VTVADVPNPELPPCRDHGKYTGFGQDVRTPTDPARDLHLTVHATGSDRTDFFVSATAVPSRFGHTSVAIEFGPSTGYESREGMDATCSSGSCRYTAVLRPRSLQRANAGGAFVLDWNTTYSGRAVLTNSLSGVQTSEPVSWKSPDKCSLSVFGNSDYSGCNLGKVNWSNSDNGIGPNRKLSGFNLNDATLNGSLFQHQRMFRTQMVGAKLNGVSFFDTSMEGANMAGAHLREAHFNGATMTGVDLSGADLTGATQLPASITEATCTNSTIWPDGTKGHGTTCPRGHNG
jgi:uncharacterized protein YjbI with pentapeptide repeats